LNLKLIIEELNNTEFENYDKENINNLNIENNDNNFNEKDHDGSIIKNNDMIINSLNLFIDFNEIFLFFLFSNYEIFN
jgi:hypothetical protein